MIGAKLPVKLYCTFNQLPNVREKKKLCMEVV